MRIAVTGRFGQIARSLVERGPNSNVDVLTLARPAVDLAQPHDLTDALAALRPQAVVSAAAYTAVDSPRASPCWQIRSMPTAPRRLRERRRYFNSDLTPVD